MGEVQPSFSRSSKVTFKKAEPTLLPCIGYDGGERLRRFRVAGSCNIVLGGLLAVHPTPATSPALIAAGDLVPGLRGLYSVTHVPSGLCIRPCIAGAKLARAYVKALVRLASERSGDPSAHGPAWDDFISDATRPSFRLLDEAAYCAALAEQ
jgi:hypothetical protein